MWTLIVWTGRRINNAIPFPWASGIFLFCCKVGTCTTCENTWWDLQGRPRQVHVEISIFWNLVIIWIPRSGWQDHWNLMQFRSRRCQGDWLWLVTHVIAGDGSREQRLQCLHRCRGVKVAIDSIDWYYLHLYTVVSAITYGLYSLTGFATCGRLNWDLIDIHCGISAQLRHWSREWATANLQSICCVLVSNHSREWWSWLVSTAWHAVIIKSWLKYIHLEICAAFRCDLKWLLFFTLSYMITWRMTTWPWQVFLNLDGERLVLLRDGWQALWYAQQRDDAPNCGTQCFLCIILILVIFV